MTSAANLTVAFEPVDGPDPSTDRSVTGAHAAGPFGSRPDPSGDLAAYVRGTRDNLAYLFATWPLALLAFCLVVPLLVLGIGTTVIWVGLPILVAAVLVARATANAERGLQRTLLHREAPQPLYQRADPGAGLGRRLLTRLGDPQSWLDVLWSGFGLVVSTVTFALALTWTVGSLATVLGPVSVFVLDRALPPGEYQPMLEGLGITTSRLADAALQAVAGLAFLVTLPWAARGLASIRASVAHAVLSQRAEQQQEIGALQSSREAGRRAETDQLRRLERDIHDGPQQRLVRLKMDLARARRLAVHDPENAQVILAEAMEQTQSTLDELRLLSRGIAPPVLVDRGLAAAVAEVAGRSLVPVQVDADVPRLADHVETAAYYVVSEALANANKHAQARSATVSAAIDHGWLIVSVTDDGHGGADLAKGHGLAGLAERVAAVDGRLDLTSPAGGPTTVRAEIPCAS